MKKKIICIMALLSVTLLLFGCSGKSAEKDNAQTLMTIGDTVITKEVFNNTLAQMAMTYTKKGISMPTDLEAKKVWLDNIVKTEVYAAKAEKEGLTVDKKALEAEGQKTYEQHKEAMGDDFEVALSANNVTEESFLNYLKDMTVKSALAEKTLAKFKEDVKADTDTYFSKVVGQIDGEDVTLGEYTYYQMKEDLTSYLTQGQMQDTSTEDAREVVSQKIFDDIALGRGLIKYCEEHNIAMTEKDLKTEESVINTKMSMYFAEEGQLETFLNYYLLDMKTYKKWVHEEAKNLLAKDMIYRTIKDNTEVKDKELQTYFKKNKDNYDQSTVSAYHILFKDKDDADEFYKEAKNVTTKTDFENLAKEYQQKEDSSVQQAVDLGAFTKDKMVEAFSEKAFSTKVNTVSTVVQTTYGYHVIFVYDLETIEPSFEENKDAVKKDYIEEKQASEYEKISKKILDKAVCVYDDIKPYGDAYLDELKEELNVTVYEKVIRN